MADETTNDIKFEGFSLVNGTAQGFDPSALDENYIQFVRTSADKSDGYIMFHGKKYGNKHVLDAGEYPDNTKA